MRHRILLAAAFVYLCVSNLVWIALDTRPPFWDMAAHQSGALRILNAVGAEGLLGLARVPSLTLPYPPLYHSVVAIFYAVFGKTVDAAQYANLPAILILLLATYGIGRTVLTPVGAAFSAVLVSFYPMLLWLSRETLIDYWLTGMVTLAIWALLRTKRFSHTGWTIAFGVVAGMGVLTKWTFPFFVALPFLWFARGNWKKAAAAVGIVALIGAFWYLPAWPALLELLRINSGHALAKGDPERWSWQALIFYIRVLEGYQIFLPLFAALIAGAGILARRFTEPWAPIVLWIAGGWAGLLLFQNKDPRYSAPLLPALALITANVVERRHVLIAPIMALLAFQHYLVSFGVRQLPQTVVLAKGVEGPLSWDWNVYSQQYHALWGPPAREDWRIEHVLGKVSSAGGPPVRLAVVPEIPRFDSSAFQFYATLGNFPVSVSRLYTPGDAAANSDYILISERDQGPRYIAPDATAVNDYILSRPERFEVLERFPLPNGDIIRLYKVGHS